MGSATNYCSNGSNKAINKDKIYTATIISNTLTNQQLSNKTNNKNLFVNSSRQDKELNYSLANPNNGTFSNFDNKLPENPLPFVRIKPKKIYN